MTTIAICEDNPAELAATEQLLRQELPFFFPEYSLHTFSSGKDLLGAITDKTLEPDLLFLDIYLDADTGKIYEFYVRTGLQWEDINTDAMIGRYAEYLELTGLEKYEDQNPLLETTPYFAKYTFPGEEEDSTTVTIGYYEGIRELFLKVGR